MRRRWHVTCVHVVVVVVVIIVWAWHKDTRTHTHIHGYKRTQFDSGRWIRARRIHRAKWERKEREREKEKRRKIITISNVIGGAQLAGEAREGVLFSREDPQNRYSRPWGRSRCAIKRVSIVKPAKMHCCTTINTHINVTKQPVLPLLAVAQHNKLHYVSKTVINM